jgi:hypothetical protein
LPVPATRARVVLLGLPVERVLLDDERLEVALLVVLALAAFVGAARLDVARPDAVALWRRSPVVPAAMIDYLTPRVITKTGGGRWIGPPRVPFNAPRRQVVPGGIPSATPGRNPAVVPIGGGFRLLLCHPFGRHQPSGGSVPSRPGLPVGSLPPDRTEG